MKIILFFLFVLSASLGADPLPSAFPSKGNLAYLVSLKGENKDVARFVKKIDLLKFPGEKIPINSPNHISNLSEPGKEDALVKIISPIPDQMTSKKALRFRKHLKDTAKESNIKISTLIVLTEKGDVIAFYSW